MNLESDDPPPGRSDLQKSSKWQNIFDTHNPPRLGIEMDYRLAMASGSAFLAGMALGASHGTTKTAFQFRAENAHRFPTSSTGWYQYHKSKNYKAVLGGLKDGMKMGAKLGAGSLAFCLFEETVDHARDRRDFLSTVTAGLSFSGIYSLLGM
jgi:hypothetical protein